MAVQNGHKVASSGQALLQHTQTSTYGCFRQDLTGFGGVTLSRTQPSTPRASYLTKERHTLRREFNLAKADCELQDTADFPSSAGKIQHKNVLAKCKVYHRYGK